MLKNWLIGSIFRTFLRENWLLGSMHRTSLLKVGLIGFALASLPERLTIARFKPYLVGINEKRRPFRRLFRLHEIGFEPMTSTTSRWHSPAELLVRCSIDYARKEKCV